MKCPACGMETPEEPGYCDFCKEPFKKKAAAAKAEARKAAQPAPVKVGPEVYAKLLEAGKAKPAKPAEPPSAPGIPPEFAHLDSGERIPEVPQTAKQLAWAFLAVVILWSIVGTVYFVHKASTLKGESGRSAPAAIPR